MKFHWSTSLYIAIDIKLHILFYMAEYRVRLLVYITSTILPPTHHCLARPRPDGSHFHRAPCRIRQHRGTSSPGWWAPQSQPVPHRWGTPSISSDRGIQTVMRRLTLECRAAVYSQTERINNICSWKQILLGNCYHVKSLVQERCIIQEMTTFVTVQFSRVKLCADSTFSCTSAATISWAAGGLMSVPVTFLFTMIWACHTVENI